MKAAQVNTYGGPDVIEVISDAPQPEVQPKQVLVEVHAASLNRIDSAFRNGYMQQMMPLEFPFIVGGDFAGIVSEVGSEVTEFQKGDAVFGNAGPFKGGKGSLSEYAIADASYTAQKPESMDFQQAAALALVGATALQGIEEHIKAHEGQKILITGGAGGVGAMAIQIAKLHGAHVATSVSGKDADMVKEFGADEVFDYKTQDVTTLLKDYDAVFDTAGGEQINTLFAVLKKGGMLVTVAGQPDEKAAKAHEVTVVHQMTAVSTAQLSRLAELAGSGKLMVKIEKTFPLDETKEAFTYFETQHPKGKVVVTIK